MAKFLTGNELNSELEKIFERADEQIILISPYIKLHDRFASTLRTKKDNHKLQITIVFGKNEEDMSRSMKQDDFNFFKEFPNIQIRYEKRLHAKYYSSESAAILTSMNLYSFSQDNNIEAGVMTKATLLGNLTNNFVTNVTGEDSFDNTASNYFKRIIEQSELLFLKTPQYESAMFGLQKKFKESKIEVDKLSDFFADKSKYDAPNRRENSYEKKRVEQPVPTVRETKPEVAIPAPTPNYNGKYFSATALSKELGISSKDLNYKIEKLNLIEKKNDDWVLTSLGISKGATMKKGQYGEYIAYPDTIIPELR